MVDLVLHHPCMEAFDGAIDGRPQRVEALVAQVPPARHEAVVGSRCVSVEHPRDRILADALGPMGFRNF